MESKGDSLATPLLSGASDRDSTTAPDTDGSAPTDILEKPNTPVPRPDLEVHPQQMPAQHMYPSTQPIPQYPSPQPYLQYQAPPSQYQPYQAQSAAQPAVSGSATPYVTYDPQTPLRTSKTFDWKTLFHNQYYLSIILCITLVLFCNPLAIICCIPAFYFSSEAINENNNNYDNALSLEKKAKCLNYTGIMYLMTVGLFVLGFGVSVGIVIAINSNGSNNSS